MLLPIDNVKQVIVRLRVWKKGYQFYDFPQNFILQSKLSCVLSQLCERLNKWFCNFVRLCCFHCVNLRATIYKQGFFCLLLVCKKMLKVHCEKNIVKHYLQVWEINSNMKSKRILECFHRGSCLFWRERCYFLKLRWQPVKKLVYF